MTLINVSNVDLNYRIYGASSRSIKSVILKAATGGVVNGDNKFLEVAALKGISFSLKEGDRLGIIGHNGSGKSSLLKVIAGIYKPNSGVLEVKGLSNCIFDVTVGLDAHLNGFENIRLRGLISGYSRGQIETLIPQIVEFSDLGAFMYMPLKSYSSGMLLRLAFSIVTHFESDILLIDEVVNVGDSDFIQKARNRISQLINKTKIVVMSTHDESLIKNMCTHVLHLEHGVQKFFGATNDFYK